VLRYPNGQIWQEGNFVNDSKEGQWTIYHPDGHIASQGAYRHNRRHGDWLLFDESGDPVSICRYLAGRLLDVTQRPNHQAA
jgi:antitoxin component YwqK of YwqJK toxin-antitoxin module